MASVEPGDTQTVEDEYRVFSGPDTPPASVGKPTIITTPDDDRSIGREDDNTTWSGKFPNRTPKFAYIILGQIRGMVEPYVAHSILTNVIQGLGGPMAAPSWGARIPPEDLASNGGQHDVFILVKPSWSKVFSQSTKSGGHPFN
eukprot:CAMPEP_0119467680 /NCGR_PEP_ID=MMETSP1344-20130328/1757_1 /TAXON_ID=236787 /ORGANISM="Florenciella parvula, Strain CCMP2471" /LENGTH=143 /DNA_ID=CAMNT_0007500067 /DNA_START=117 /DNA_END=548 /DNA_ORIENTATION=-